MSGLSIREGEWVVVCDGAKALVLQNAGDAKFPNLKTLEVFEQKDPPTHEQGADRPGRTNASVGPGRSAVSQTDWHDRAEEAFLTKLAHHLDAAVAAGGDGVAEDLRFHHAIAQASGNPFLVQALGFFSQYLEEAIGVTRSNEARREDFARQVRDEHRAMVEAIRNRDALAARSAAQTHMFNAARRLAEGRGDAA